VAIKNIVARPRPYASEVEAFKEWWTFAGAHLESEVSFPSGHTTAAVAPMLAICLCFFKKYKWIVAPTAFYAIIMGFSRNYLVVHYPSDVLAAFIVGSVAAVIAFFLAKLIWNALENHSGNKLSNFALTFDIRSLFKKAKRKSANDAHN
jgi:undecaprenyl-diphosphatase